MANIILGLFSPARFDLKEYLGYDITKFKDNIRFLEVIVNRDGEMGGIIALHFDGAVCTFSELPQSTDKEGLQKVYSYMQSVRQKNKAFFIYNSKRKKKHGSNRRNFRFLR